MTSVERKDHQTVSAKVPAATLADLDRIALYRGVSRSSLIRELIEAAVAGRVALGIPERTRGHTLAELAASDVGEATRQRAQLDAAVACRGVAVTEDDGAAPRDLDEALRRRRAQIALEEQTCSTT